MSDPDTLGDIAEGDGEPAGIAVDGLEIGGEESPYVNIEAEAGEIGGDLNVAETINHLYLPDRPRLSLRHFECYGDRQVAEQASHVVAAARDVQSWTSALERFRLLVLTGEAESGKATLVWRLAGSLAERHRCRELLLCRHSLARNVQVRFDDFAGPRYAGRFVVLRDALESGNVDLARFVRTLDEARLSALSAALGGSEVFVVLTADAATLADAEPKLRALGILAEVGPLPADLLVEGLAALALRLPAVEDGDRALRTSVERLLAEHGRTIVERLRTMPRISRFAHELLVEVAAGRVKVDQALDRAGDLRSWLLRDLTEDFDAWCYALALALCHAAAQPDRLPWVQFDRFRQELARHFDRVLRRARAERPPVALCQEAAHCRTARAEIAQPGFPEACTIRFCDDSYPRELWRVLLGPGKALLGVARPLLASLATAEEPFLRSLSAQIVGRMGELAPLEIVLPRIERDEFPLGPLFRGILSSEDDGYRSRCMTQLRGAMTGSRVDLATKAVAALVDIGRLDLGMALDELRAVCAGELAPAADRETLGRAVAALEERSKDAEARRVLVQLEIGNPRTFLIKVLPARRARLLDAVRFTLVGLAMARGPIEVIAGLASWGADPALGPLLALLFFRSFGVFAYLEKLKSPGVDEPTRRYSPVLSWSSADDAETLADFLAAAYADAGVFPGVLRQGLRRRWIEVLKDWAGQVAGAGEHRDAVASLLRALLASERAGVAAEVLRLLRFDPDFARPGSDLAALALEVLTAPRSRNRALSRGSASTVKT